MNIPQRRLVLVFALAALLAGLLVAFVTLEGRWPAWRLVDEPLHATVEALGGLVAILMATFLLQRKREAYAGTLFLLALGFIGMGLLDLFHAITPPGNGFVLLHSAATLVGGFWFALAWFPRLVASGEQPWKRWVLPAVVASAVAFGVWTLVARDTLPAMTRDATFTGAAVAINVLAGTFFVLGAARLLLDFQRTNELEIYLLACMAGLFGVASLMFPYSALWDRTWWIWHFLRLTAYVLALGFALHQYQGTVSDLGRALVEHEEAEGRLRNAEARYRTLFEQSPAGIVIIDPVTALPLEFNEMAHRQLGYTRDEFATLRVGEYEANEAPQETKTRIERLMGGGREDFETRHRTKQGDLRNVLVTVQKLDPSDRAVLHCVLRDITELKRAEERLAALVQELRRSNADLEQFAYVASHDLQEPLRMVASYTQLLARRYRGRLDADAGEFIAYAVDGATRMQRLISDLLAYSRVNTRGGELEATDAEAALRQALANLQKTLAEGGAIVTHDPLPTVRADPLQLVQVFQNLIGNAAKFRGEAQPRIHVSAVRGPGRSARSAEDWTFSVRDNGIGIDPAHHERIFVIFQRLHNRGAYPGTGIGLAICKKIVDRHGGRLWVESRLGGGSTFFFTIPTGQEDATRAIQVDAGVGCP